MIIYDFYFFRIGSCPNKTDAPLVVDADAVLSCSASLQSFKPVARRDAQAVETNSSV